MTVNKNKQMKKLLLISSFLIFSATVINAQSNFEIGFRYNPEFTGIVNSSDANAGNELKYASQFSYIFSFGAGAIYHINEHYGVAVDILFSREGQAFTGTLTNSKAEHPEAYSAVVARQIKLNDIKIDGDYVALDELNYIKIPVMLSVTTDIREPVFFGFMVGPQFNILHSVAQEVNGTDLDYPTTDVTPSSIHKSFTLAGVLALGVGYNLSSNLVLSAHLRMDYGFGDAENKDAMISTSGAAPVRFYSTDRAASHSESEGLLIGLNFKL